MKAAVFSIPLSVLFAVSLWVFSLYSLFFLSGPFTWVSGFIYVTYDTLLIAFVASTSFERSEKTRQASSASALPSTPTMAVMITGRNEAHVISECLEAVARQESRPEEVLWVDDGSTDESVAILEKWQRDPRLPLRVLARENAGKASAMNAAWPTLQSEVILTLDADTILDPGAVGALREAFHRNPRLAVNGGLLDVKSFDRPGGIFERFQRFEYMRSFIARKAWMNCRALILVSGAFAAYRKSVLQATGGFDPKSRVEDYELTHRIYRLGLQADHAWEVAICTEAWATTDVPGHLSKLLKQRERWFAGFIETHWQNRDLVGNSRLGNLGRWMLPIKSVDMIQPLLGLTAFTGLVSFLYKFIFTHTPILIPRLVAEVLLGKILLDLCFHYYSIFAYYRWKRQRVPFRVWCASTFSTFLEPFSFQLFRHTGAMLGWIAVITGRKRW